MNKRRNRAAGFTLIELLLVVVIIGILAAIVVPKLAGRGEDAKKAAASGDIKSLSTALTMYEVDNQMYPTTDQGLAALLQKPGGAPEAPNWRNGGYIDRLPQDPWKRDYIYLQPGQRGDFDLYSLGADGQPGGEGANADIGNWGD